MRRLLRWLVANPGASLLFVAAALVGGGFAALHLPVGLFPGLDVPVVNVITHLPGAAPEDMDLLVVRPIEDRLAAIPGVRRIAARSVEGISQVTVEFEWGTRLNDARQIVQTQVAAVRPDLPSGVDPRLENIGTTLQEVAGYVVYGAGDPVQLRRTLQKDVASRLMGVDGVSRVQVLGGDLPAFLVRLDPAALARAHLTVRDVAHALAEHNLASSLGVLDRGSRQYLVRGDGRMQSVEDVEAVPVAARGARSILLGDVASVTEGRAPRHYRVHGNGVPAVALLVSKQPAASTIAVAKGLDRSLHDLESLLPRGTKVRKFYDQADLIVEARDSLFHDLLLGALVAAVVLYLFLGTLRATLIVAATIPIALLATLALLEVAGETLNVVTLSALTLAVGLVLDDAIVVAESILRRLRAGHERAAAAAEGGAEISAPDASGTFTTVAAFAPLLFLGGIAGLFVRPFGYAVSAALLASLLVSLSFLPMMFGRFGLSGPRRPLGAPLLKALDRALQRTLRAAFSHRWLVILLAFAALGLAALFALRLRSVQVLPPIDEGALLVEYTMPPGTSLAESNRIADHLERDVLAQPGVSAVYRRTGSPAGGFQIEPVNQGEMTVKLAPRSERRRTADEIANALRARFDRLPGMVFTYRQPTQEKMDESLSGLPAVFGVTIFGPDQKRLVSLAAKVEAVLSGDPALSNIVNNTKVAAPEILVRPDPVALARVGLSPKDVFATLRAARFGYPATTVIRKSYPVAVLVRMPAPRPPTLDWLETLSLPTPSGNPVPLGRVCDVEVSSLPAAVTRRNRQREVTVTAEVEGSIPAAAARLHKRFESLKLPAGYSIAFTGQYAVLQRTIRDFALIGIAALLLIYLVMALQFRSWLEPLVILVTVPTALVGAVLLLALSHVGLDVSAGMGALTLVGIAVNNAIVLLEYANREERAGKARNAALLSAASVRLRPILMTSAVTLLALVPVAVDPGVGSRLFHSFAIAVIGGLITSTLATLVLVPVLRSVSPPGSGS